MRSYQNIAILQNLYRLKAIGFDYVDPIIINTKNDEVLSDDIYELSNMINTCYLCDLSKSRHQSMSGFGNTNADLVFVDAFVSSHEDETNNYFASRSGQSLQIMIEKVLHLNLNDIFLTHGVKCTPLGTNQPSPSEYKSCFPYLQKQLEIIKPRIVVALGEEAYKLLNNNEDNFEAVRGEIITLPEYKLIPMYHPAYLLRNPSMKKLALQDLNLLKAHL